MQRWPNDKMRYWMFIDSLRSKFRTWQQQLRLPCTILSRDPPILVAFWEDLLTAQDAILATLPVDRPSFIFCQFGWEYESAGRSAAIATAVADLRCRNPNLSLILLANSQVEHQQLQQLGLRSIHCQQNAFLDARRYHLVDLPLRYDAVYLARITPFKRHYLAVAIPSLYLIGDYSEQERAFAEAALRDLSHATWQRKVAGRNVSRHLANAAVGLCLSNHEGAMFVSAEYLLSGLTVVTTRAIGGRDCLFDPQDVVTVDDDAAAVATGVMQAKLQRQDRSGIRRRVLALMEVHRQRFRAELQRIYDETKTPRSADNDWPRLFLHKFGLRCGVGPITLLTRSLRHHTRFDA